MKRIKKYVGRLLILSLIGTILLWANYEYVSYGTEDLVYDNVNDIPKTEYALFLGTPKYLSNGEVNNYYKNRIKATIELYTNEKIKRIVVSADTLNKYRENEVELIKSDLINEGVTESDILSDNNGNGTWKSVSYIEEHFSKNKFVLISQKFHLERALHITKRKELKAIGFIAKGEMSNRLWIREILARVKMQLDLL